MIHYSLYWLEFNQSRSINQYCVPQIKGCYLWELDDDNSLDACIKKKICEFCLKPKSVLLTRTAERDMAVVPVSKSELLEGVRCYVQNRGLVNADYMDNGDLAFIVQYSIKDQEMYVKVKFSGEGHEEEMYVISAHPPRRW